MIGILTADDLPSVDAPNKPILTNEPNYVGEPIPVGSRKLTLAQDALEKIRIDWSLYLTVTPCRVFIQEDPMPVQGNVVGSEAGKPVIKETK